MIDDEKSIIDQVHDYETICINIVAEGLVIWLVICEYTQSIVLIEKLPPSWKDYRNLFMHEKRDLTLEELVGHLKIEGKNHLKDKPSIHVVFPKANLVESKHSNNDRNQQKGK